MSQARRQIKLGAFLMETGHHVAAWRHAKTHLTGGLDFAHYAQLAQIAERAKFDAVFFADSVGIRDTNLASLSRTARADHFEPLTLLAALSVATTHIGLIATVSTTFNVARKFASLDHLSGGRSGWNLVTSSSETEALNFGFEQHPAHAVRYERAREFLDVVTGLWDSWEDDAFVRDRESGIYFDPGKLHVLNHRGPHFKVRGPLNVARSPQGWPVVVQAGASDAGRELAAQTAEVIFVAHQTLDEAKAFYRDVKGRLGRYGRRPEDLKIMPGILPVIGKTHDEARAKFNALQDLIHPDVGLALLSKMTGGVDLSAYPVEGPLPDLPETNGGKSRQQLLFDLARRRENLSIRDLYLRIAGARGHQQIVGTPESIADQLQQWFEEEGADGFNIMSPWLPGGLTEFAELVVPELQRRGLFRTEYEGKTLRKNLGLPRPENRHAQVARQRLAG
ncbi:nitrilotriacetate monooxygenase component A [Caballeronia sordidicola]|uniref:Nitrilotriacetate monooxygenase component A n=1 Tax=Caballeronia sordidicola TaxID=196367 RepID=A0A158H9A0_CABSO|nr:LLM class flavin-dependent oxidoreductase [Caballeronia sordidicola]SAL40573.1 nitrilotriacetate monooxygenase component A [Caballeronia sordidicola]